VVVIQEQRMTANGTKQSFINRRVNVRFRG
jgi:hypothetical protein